MRRRIADRAFRGFLSPVARPPHTWRVPQPPLSLHGRRVAPPHFNIWPQLPPERAQPIHGEPAPKNSVWSALS
jgi:hypothetical protein